MKHLIVILTVVIPLFSMGQLTTSPGSAAALVQNVLLGNGVTVSNITYNGSPASIGSFTAVNSNLGLSSGVVLTTGTILNNGSGPHGPNNSDGSGMDNGAPGYGPLGPIAGAQTFNAAVLEFDFVPYSDS
ncbi:MAG: choice-of-anchor L domain-containing protein, partial [Flavobacteriales bacterium]